MKFAQVLTESVADKNLLNHAFYQAWNEGSIPLETLREYATQYYHHVKAFPRYISATHSKCSDLSSRQVLLENLIEEEHGSENHPELWRRFAKGLGVSQQEMEGATLMPEIRALVDGFMGFANSSFAEGLGALFAYEHQIPAIAKFKTEALQQHYSIHDPATLAFFEVHKQADIYHTEALGVLLDKLSPEEKDLAKNATRVTAERLWQFLDGMVSQMPKSSQ